MDMMLTLMLYFQQHCEKGAYFTCQLRKSLSSLTSCLWLQSNSDFGKFPWPISQAWTNSLHATSRGSVICLSLCPSMVQNSFRTLPVHTTNQPADSSLRFHFFFLFHLHFLPNSLLEIQIFVSQGKLDKRLSWRKGNDREDLKKNSSWCWEEREKNTSSSWQQSFG